MKAVIPNEKSHVGRKGQSERKRCHPEGKCVMLKEKLSFRRRSESLEQMLTFVSMTKTCVGMTGAAAGMTKIACLGFERIR